MLRNCSSFLKTKVSSVHQEQFLTCQNVPFLNCSCLFVVMNLIASDNIVRLLSSSREDGSSVSFVRSEEVIEPFVLVGLPDCLLLERYGVIWLAPEPIMQLSHGRQVCCGVQIRVPFVSFSMHELVQEGVPQVCDALMVAARRFEKVVIVISLTVLDRAFTSEGSVGGLTIRELLYFLMRLRLVKNIVGWCIVGKDERIIAKIVGELC